MISLKKTSSKVWDLLVVGAGPAGALAARQMARRGASVLLVDKAPIRRWKVCGCCLNGAAASALQSADLGSLPRQLGGILLDRIQIANSFGRVDIPLTESIVISREAFDAALADSARDCGAVYLPNTLARPFCVTSQYRETQLVSSQDTENVKSRLVLAADGLGGKFIEHDNCCVRAGSDGSRIGAGAVLRAAPNWVKSGIVYMSCSAEGYLGTVMLEDGRINMAASLDRSVVRNVGGLAHAAAKILSHIGLTPPDDLLTTRWRGTPELTQSPARLWSERLLVLGDAAGYVEPFTGEGMAWALSSAIGIEAVATRAIEGWSNDIGKQWAEFIRRSIHSRQSICRRISWGLRHPFLVNLSIILLKMKPSIANPFIRQLNTPISSC